MPIFHAIVLGIIQGLTEFLPISSTAHLIVIPWLLGWDDGGLTFDVALHVGTLAAVILYFFRDWIQVIGQGLGMNIGRNPALSKNRNLLWLLVAATIPGGVIGYLFEKQAATSLRSPYIIGASAILIGIVMWVADRNGRKAKDISHVSSTDALIIGTAQALAIVPGVSRSGITISAGLFRGFDRQTAARFSFLLLTPIIAGAAAKKFLDVRKEGGIPVDMHTPFLVGMIVSAVVGGLTIQFFLNYLRRRSLSFFVWYRIFFGIIVIALATFFRSNGR
jgi:undecaprenyl-diphosphatase